MGSLISTLSPNRMTWEVEHKTLTRTPWRAPNDAVWEFVARSVSHVGPQMTSLENSLHAQSHMSYCSVSGSLDLSAYKLLRHLVGSLISIGLLLQNWEKSFPDMVTSGSKCLILDVDKIFSNVWHPYANKIFVNFNVYLNIWLVPANYILVYYISYYNSVLL